MLLFVRVASHSLNLAYALCRITSYNVCYTKLLRGPLIPDAHSVLLQIGNIGFPFQEPQQFVNNRFQVQLFGGQQRKTILQIETHLVTKNALGTCAGAVGSQLSMVQYVLQ